MKTAEEFAESQAQVLARLRAWEHAHRSRDELIRLAYAAGLPKKQIAELMGLARQTVYRALAGDR